MYFYTPEQGVQRFASFPFDYFDAAPIAWIGVANNTVWQDRASIRYSWNSSEPIVNLYASYFSNSIIMSSESIFSWGESHVTGDGTMFRSLDKPAPVNLLFMPPVSQIKLIAVAQSDTLLVMQDGTIYAWGTNEFGTLGTGNTMPLLLPTKVALPWKISHLSCFVICVAVTFDNEIVSWGFARRSEQVAMQQIVSFVDYTVSQRDPIELVTGNWNTFVLLSEKKKIWAWGINTFGITYQLHC